MHSVLLLSALAGLAASSPVAVPLAAPMAEPQEGLDFSIITDAKVIVDIGPPEFTKSDPIDYNPIAASASAALAASTAPPSLEKRDAFKLIKRTESACSSQPSGAGPATSPDTDTAFLQNDAYTSIAQNAATPQGYNQAFSNIQSAIQGPSYLGYYTLDSYDPVKCQEYCDAATSCYAFNIYFERDASEIPGDSCSNPPSTVNIKCSLWGAPVSSGCATNNGQYQEDFHVVIAGSNGYNKDCPPPSYSGFDGPTELGGAIQGVPGYIGSSMFSGPFDPSQCAATCTQTTQFDKEHIVHDDGTYDACNFFNAFVVSKNNVPQGTSCQYYTAVYDKSDSTNYGQYDSDGNYYSVSSSYGYSLSPQDSGHI